MLGVFVCGVIGVLLLHFLRSSAFRSCPCIMFAPRRAGGGGGSDGGGGASLNLQKVFALCGLLLLVPQLASSSILAKLSEDPDLSQVRGILLFYTNNSNKNKTVYIVV